MPLQHTFYTFFTRHSILYTHVYELIHVLLHILDTSFTTHFCQHIFLQHVAGSPWSYTSDTAKEPPQSGHFTTHFIHTLDYTRLWLFTTHSVRAHYNTLLTTRSLQHIAGIPWPYISDTAKDPPQSGLFAYGLTVVCCSVLQCCCSVVAVCCSVSQYVAVCCSVSYIHTYIHLYTYIYVYIHTYYIHMCTRMYMCIRTL